MASRLCNEPRSMRCEIYYETRHHGGHRVPLSSPSQTYLRAASHPSLPVSTRFGSYGLASRNVRGTLAGPWVNVPASSVRSWFSVPE